MADRMATTREVLPGDSRALGATYDGAGTNFAIFSTHAERVELSRTEHPSGARKFKQLGGVVGVGGAGEHVLVLIPRPSRQK